MTVSYEERQRLYQEEKAREEISEQLRRERSEDRPKLTKSSKDKVLFGVAGGLAEHFDIDPLLVRLGFVALCFADGIGLLLYAVLAFIMHPRSTVGPNLIGFLAIAIVLVVMLGVLSSTVAVFRFIF